MLPARPISPPGPQSFNPTGTGHPLVLDPVGDDPEARQAIRLGAERGRRRGPVLGDARRDELCLSPNVFAKSRAMTTSTSVSWPLV